MRTIISNKIIVIDPIPELIYWAQDNLIIENPTYSTMMRLGKEDTIARKHIPEKMKLYAESGFDLIFPFGVLYAIWPFISKGEYELRFNNNGDVISRDMKISMPLYPYQEKAVQDLLRARGGILEGSCGCGKTQIGIELAKRIGKNTLWLCHTGDLLTQTVKRIHQLYPELPVGTITEGSVNMVKNGITVSTVQTLVNVEPDIYRKAFDTVITDEVHHVSGSPTLSKMHVSILSKIAARYKYGLSATLTRADTLIKSMYAYVGCNPSGEFAPVTVIEKEKTKTLTAKHIRIDLDTPFSYDTLDESGMLDYPAMIDFLSANEKRNQDIVNNVVKTLEKHSKQLVLCQRIEQCEALHKMLLEKGVDSVLLVGKVTKKQRDAILSGHKNWNVIVATMALAKEGLDVPELSCLHWAMVVSDKVATIQSAGRIERVFEGKPAPEIYDYVDKNYPYCIGKWKKRVSFLRKR